MKTVMRVCAVAGADASSVVQVLLERLTRILAEVQKNPRNPMFNHYLFETIAVLVRSVCSQDRGQVDAFEAVLFGPFEVMLAMEQCAEFGPYVFQILGQLLALHEQVPPTYEEMFPLLLSPAMWSQSGSIQALSQLIQVYLSKPTFASAVASSERLEPVLGVFQKLISSKLNDKYGFVILRSLVHRAPWQNLAGLFPKVVTLLLQRAKSSMTVQFQRQFVAFLSDFACTRGVEILVGVLESIQPGLSSNVISQIWLRYSPDVSDPLERKVVVLGLAHLVAKAPVMLSGALADVWPHALCTLVDMLEDGVNGSKAKQKSRDEVSEEMLDRLQEQGGYSNVYSRLAFALNERVDEYPSIEPAVFFVSSLADLCRSHPGQLQARVQQALNASQMQVLQTMLQKHNVSLV